MLAALALSFPVIDPIAVQLGPIAIRWYALAYVAGIVLGYFILRRINLRMSQPVLTKAVLDDLIFWAVLGVVLGGRFGYVLFYNLDYYLSHPAQIFQVWQGGMAFHGGMLGVIAAFWWAARKHSVPYLQLMDQAALVAPIGLLLGRLANFINGELYGRPSDTPWAMVFPAGGEVARHPSQLYQAGLEGLVLFALLWWLQRRGALEKHGLLSGVFLIGYAVARSVGELFREPDAQLGLLIGGATMGQLLCVPMLLLGIYLVRRARGVRA